MLTCPKCVAELTQPVVGDTTTCPHCGLMVHVSSLSPLKDAVESEQPPTQTYLADREAESPKAAGIPRQMGRYEILSLLGTGGFSLVYLASDMQLGRRVALKVMRPERLKEKAYARALFEEARIAAQLEHPGFVPVYDVAQDDLGTPFLVMQYLPGKSLHERLHAAAPTFVETAELIRKLASTIHFAHKQRLCHRDLKPSNILFDAAGQPHIADLGLAVTEHSQIKRANEWAGTLPYMAPEQMRGETHRLDGRCDIWSLGVIMYEMLTGKRPFRGETAQISDEIQHREPRPLRQLNERIPAALEQICLKCLRKSLTDRYLSAFDLSADLEQWLRGPEGSNQTPGSDSNSSRPISASSQIASAAQATNSGDVKKRPLAWLVGTSIPLLILLLFGVAYGIPGLSGPQPTGKNGSQGPDAGRGGGGAQGDDDQQANPDAVLVPVQDVDQFVPRRWHDLLTQPPQKLIWNPTWETASLNYDKTRHSVSVDTPDIALLTLGQTQAEDFRLQFSVAKSAWVGNVGFFWGYHEANLPEGRDKPECHVLWVRSINSEGVGVLRMERQRWQFRTVPNIMRPLVDPLAIAAESVNPPRFGGEAVFELMIRQNELTVARWCGQDYPPMGISQSVAPPAALSAAGKFGIVVAQGAATFSDARFMLTRE